MNILCTRLSIVVDLTLNYLPYRSRSFASLKLTNITTESESEFFRDFPPSLLHCGVQAGIFMQ